MAAPQILLVDDNPTNLQVLYQTLEGQGYRLLAARTGKDAIAIAERAAPDLILLDVLMPDLDGYETCARLKADDRTRDCAIIFLSALNDARDRAHGLELGAVDFVNKPFQAEEILARVKTHLTIRELQQQLRRHNVALQHGRDDFPDTEARTMRRVCLTPYLLQDLVPNLRELLG